MLSAHVAMSNAVDWTINTVIDNSVYQIQTVCIYNTPTVRRGMWMEGGGEICETCKVKASAWIHHELKQETTKQSVSHFKNDMSPQNVIPLPHKRTTIH